MKFMSAGIILIVFLPVFAFADQPKPGKSTVVIGPKTFTGFEKCKISKELWSAIDSIYENPKRKIVEDSVLVYEAKGNFYGMPIKEIWIGVCDDGSRDCGWASFIALIIPIKVNDVKKRLKEKFGIDFIKEKLDPEIGATLQPILKISHQNKNESLLYCVSD